MSYQQAAQTASLLADGLEEIAVVTGDQLGLADPARHLRSRAESLRTDRFKIVVVGGFSRGKSTLLNAVLGCDILPQKVTPSTAIITVIEYADLPRAVVKFVDRSQAEETLSLEEFRKRYVLDANDFTEGQVDADRFTQVDYAVVSYPLELCRHRVELVDSPGLQDDPVRTGRTKKFLKRADAVVMVLDATTLLTQEEIHFLETVLLPEGLKNIFFIINKWNLVEQSVLRPEDAEREFAGLESRIRDRLFPFCMISGRDKSVDRIFRVNALGALKARMRKPPSAAMLEDSNVPTFEASLQRFLVEDRGKARTDVILGTIKTTCDEVIRFIATQLVMLGKSVAEVEAELTALQPKLERLRGIRKHIVGFLDTQAANLQDRLVISFQDYIKRIDASLPAEVEKFDLSEITKGSMVWASLTDWARSEENKFAKNVERCIKPQVQRLLERRFAEWQQAVVKNEMQAVMIDVDKHLQEEAAEYQRVMREIEERIGIHGSSLQVSELVERWLGRGEGSGAGKFDLSGIGVFGDLGWVVGSIAVDVVAEVFLHTAVVWLPIVGLAISAARLAWREVSLRGQIREKIVHAVREGLVTASQTEAAKIRARVKEGFDGLKNKIAGNIDEEIAIIDASLQSIIDRKMEKEFSAENEKKRLEAARAAIASTVARIHSALLTVPHGLTAPRS